MSEILKPQPGFQEAVLATPADIAFMGGSAGCGKTFVELLEGTRHVQNPHWGWTMFRRTTPQITNTGGLWDTSQKVFPHLGAKAIESRLKWRFPSGCVGRFAHLENEDDVLNYQGAQIPLIIWDELTHFTENQFWYMLSRNRSDCGIRPYMRGSCNPDPHSWVAPFIAWYIDDDGWPIPERCGRLRYFTRSGDDVIWGDTWQEVYELAPQFKDPDVLASGVNPRDLIKSFTFIPGSIYENKLFLQEDPGYLGNLLAMPEEEKKRLLRGNWKVSLDGLSLVQYDKLEQIYDNWPNSDLNPLRCMTVDAARFGRDFCVILVWKGFEVVFMVVMKYSDAFDITGQIEKLRMRFNVMRENVIVDQDGVGDGTVKMGHYTGFHGGAAPKKDPDSRVWERYANYKTQCYYRFAQRINEGEVRLSITNETCLIFDGSAQNGVHTTKIKVGSVVRDVRDLIKEDWRAMKRRETANMGTDKIQMNTKDEQKAILRRSPDFSDACMMREDLEIRGQRPVIKRKN